MHRIVFFTAPPGAPSRRTRWPLPLLALALAGCAAVPPTDYAPVADRLAARLPATAAIALTGDDSAAVRTRALLGQPLDPAAAVQLTLLHSPALRAELAALGVAQADLVQAGLIGNPRLAVGALRPEGGGRWQLDFGLSASLLDALTRPLRRSLAQSELQRVQLAVTAALQRELNAVQRDYYAALAAAHRAALLAAIEAAAGAGRDLARRRLEAGNVPELDFLREHAEFEQRRLATAEARAEAERARLRLAQRIGLANPAPLRLPAALPDIPEERFEAGALQALALRDRLDLQLARQARTGRQRELALLRGTRGVAEWELGAAAERETDGATRYGPELAVELPLFDQGQARVASAESRLARSEARIEALELAARSEVAQALLALATARERAAALRALIPQRQRIVELSLRNYNYMLDGIDVALRAKREEYATWLDYIDTVGAYWLARSRLALAVGGALPAPKMRPAPLPDLDAPSKAKHGIQSHHGTHGTPPPAHADHGGQAMPATAEPHAEPAHHASRRPGSHAHSTHQPSQPGAATSQGDRS